MNSAQLRAKIRKAMDKRAQELEEEESGDLNLTPYLDMVMNVMVFLLASITAGYVLGQINTTLPSSVPADSVSSAEPEEDPDEQPLQLVVSVAKQQILVWSASGLEGTLNDPRATIPRTNQDESDPTVAPEYDYQKLNDVLYEIAERRWAGGERDRDTYEVILQADGDIPYETIVQVMDNLRRRLPEEGIPGEGERPPQLAVPAEGEEYDPDVHPLFPDVLFSMGFE